MSRGRSPERRSADGRGPGAEDLPCADGSRAAALWALAGLAGCATQLAAAAVRMSRSSREWNAPAAHHVVGHGHAPRPAGPISSPFARASARLPRRRPNRGRRPSWPGRPARRPPTATPPPQADAATAKPAAPGAQAARRPWPGAADPRDVHAPPLSPRVMALPPAGQARRQPATRPRPTRARLPPARYFPTLYGKGRGGPAPARPRGRPAIARRTWPPPRSR